MFFLIFGIRSSKVKSKELKGNTVCSKCNSVESFNVQGSASYFYLFWIPLIPLRKSVEFICRKCGQHHYKETAPRNVISNYESEPLKRPKWHFLGLGLIATYFITLNAYGFFKIAKDIKSQKEYEVKIYEENKEFYNDLALVTADPSMKNDTISKQIKASIDFTPYSINQNDVSYFSKQNSNKLLVLLNIEKGQKIDDVNRILLIK
ncbi:hypothetical protein, partial [Winogradskyella sp.]|uniref:hypothetical protein n=1 Tax=Winogradskyella sp. TaxID=1883156 RepID=UPI0025EBD8C6